MRKTLAVTTTLVLAGSVLTVAAPPVTAAKTYKACVKKSTGETRILLGKKKQKKWKCKKGWKRATWTKAGPSGTPGTPGNPGPTGARSTLGTVVDANGAVVGESLSTLAVPGMVQFVIRIDGGTYVYFPNGWLLTAGNVTYSDAACATAPFTRFSTSGERDLGLSDAGYRVVYRSANPTLGPASAYRLVGTSQPVVNAQHYERNELGVCTAEGALFTGYVLPLTSVPAPPDRPGPLMIQ